MKQTNQYQLNLIEPNDDFLPDPLNENTQKLETVLSQFQAESQSTLSSLITGLGSGGQNCRIAYINYVGSGDTSIPLTLEVGFYPICALFSSSIESMSAGSSYVIQPIFLFRDFPRPVTPQVTTATADARVEWRDTGLTITGSERSAFMAKNVPYVCLVIGFSKLPEQGE